MTGGTILRLSREKETCGKDSTGIELQGDSVSDARLSRPSSTAQPAYRTIRIIVKPSHYCRQNILTGTLQDVSTIDVAEELNTTKK